ncbi:Nucleoside-diphosphate-sugar epimerase [Catalinimonas alkaloidigena]|uniref:Nucleoside-diphosphate-sugar epimerase n=1 Tax=Catalinimonas alkaloidigena TaxID=1075417 RepID=A0A1G9AS35_9BACT|nr:NAD(P)H-binding protein [Catalinimonas alkaloidigena]SDK30136.1 Nucleoside-diphosphate-sugar epimerase [Catalinimonas alkaloidigena]
MKERSISVVGCGWLGLPLARHFVAQGWQVKGSTTRPEKLEVLAASGIQPFLIRLDPHAEGDALPALLESDVVVVNTPPSKTEDYPAQMQVLAEAIPAEQTPHILFVSSTSIYPPGTMHATEEMTLTPENAGHRTIAEAEHVWQQQRFPLTILRCSGLMGYDRIPGKYTAGKVMKKPGEAVVNLVFRDDVVRAVEAIVQQARWGEIYNLVAPVAVNRATLYAHTARQLGFAPTQFQPDGSEDDSKRIIGEKIQRDLNFTFQYPDPRTFPYGV